MNSNLHPVMQQALRPFLPQHPDNVSASANDKLSAEFDDVFESLLQPRKKPMPAHYHVILAHALYDLNVKVNAGGEFPDNVNSMVDRYGVRQEDLENLYDAQFN